MGASYIIRTCDNFSSNVSFTFKGRSQYKTVFGGAITLVIYILMLCFFIIIINEPLKSQQVIEDETNDEPSNNSTPIETDENYLKIGDVEFIGDYKVTEQTLPFFETFTNEEGYRPQDDGFTIAVRLNSNSFNLNSSLFFLSVYFAYFDYDIGNYNLDYPENLVCSVGMFPDELEEEVIAASTEGNYLCPNISNVELLGNNLSYLLVIVEMNVQYCVDNNLDCFDEVAAKLPEEIDIIWSESYYDRNSPYDPVKHNQLRSCSVPVTTSYTFGTIEMTLNQVKLHNNTTVTFNQLDMARSGTYGFTGSSFLTSVSIVLSDRYHEYEEYLDYQPYISNSTRNLKSKKTSRNLDSETEDDLMSPLYFAFYICAQLGGFYSFCTLLLSPIINRVNTKSFLQDVINQAFLLYKAKSSQLNLAKEMNQAKGKQKIVPEGPLNHQQSAKKIPYSYPNQVDPEMSEQDAYDGGENRDLLRRRNLDQQTPRLYDTTDLIYSILCCASNDKEGRKTRAGKYAKFKQEAISFDSDRDIVQFLDSLSSLRTQIIELETKFNALEEIVKTKNDSYSPQKLPTFAANSGMDPKVISSDIGILEEEKGHLPVSHQNSSLSQILDEIDNHKGGPSTKPHAKAINSIISNELRPPANYR